MAAKGSDGAAHQGPGAQVADEANEVSGVRVEQAEPRGVALIDA